MAKKSSKRERSKRIKKQERERLKQKKIEVKLEAEDQSFNQAVDITTGEIIEFPDGSEIILTRIEQMIDEYKSKTNKKGIDDSIFNAGALNLKAMLEAQIQFEEEKNSKEFGKGIGRKIVAWRLEENANDAINFARQAFWYQDLPLQRYSLDQLAHIIADGSIGAERLIAIGNQAEINENWEI